MTTKGHILIVDDSPSERVRFERILHDNGFETTSVDNGEEGIEVDRAFIEYRRSALARFRLGKINTPAGIWKPIHWSIAVDTISEPIMEDNDFIPTKTEGFSFAAKVMRRSSAG